MTPCGRAARPLCSTWVLVLLFIAAPQGFFQAPSFDDLLSDLAAAIASALAPNEPIRVVKASAEAPDVRELLAQRGASIVDDMNAATVISYTCAETIRERVCVADVRRGEASQLVSVQRPREPAAAGSPAAPLTIELRPVVAQPTPILDVAVLDNRLLVLDPSSVTRYERTDQGWLPRDSKPIVMRTPWPRDVRGRLTVDRNAFEAFLPGVGCRGTIDPVAVSCVEERRSWPLGIENGGIAPTANYFSLIGNRRYYTFAPVAENAPARWLAATEEGRIALLDAAGAPLGSAIATGDDVAALTSPCISGSHVVLAAPAAANSSGDTLRLFRLVGRDLTPVTPPVILTGSLRALWPAPDATSATVVSHNPSAGRYEAFQLRVACGR